MQNDPSPTRTGLGQIKIQKEFFLHFCFLIFDFERSDCADGGI